MTSFLLYTEDYPSLAPEPARQTGIGRYCSDLAAGLAQLGHSVAVLTADDGLGSGASASANPTVERAGGQPRRAPGLLRRAATLRARVAALGADYLLVGDPVAHQVAAVGSLSVQVPYCPIFYGTELRGYRELVGYRGWHPGRRLRRSLLASYVQRAHRPICISRYTSRCLGDLGLRARDECIVFPAVSEPFVTRAAGAITVDDWRAARPVGAAGDVVRFITVARISERKNQLQVLEALALLRRRHGLSFQYVIVGNVDSREHEGYLASIVRFTREHDLDDSVFVIGGATDEQKIAWIDASDVFVMLSRTVGNSVEGFGISVIEASCRGKPVVVSDQGGMPETIVEGQTGFSVSPDSIEAVATPLLTLARQPELRRTLGANGARFVRDNFTPRRMAERLVAQLGLAHGPAVVAPPGAYTPAPTQTPVRP